MFSQAKKLKKLYDPSDCSEWSGGNKKMPPPLRGTRMEGAITCSYRPAHLAAKNLGLGVGRVTR